MGRPRKFQTQSEGIKEDKMAQKRQVKQDRRGAWHLCKLHRHFWCHRCPGAAGVIFLDIFTAGSPKR